MRLAVSRTLVFSVALGEVRGEDMVLRIKGRQPLMFIIF